MTEEQIMNFETKDEFMKYYDENKEELDKLKTVDLNKKYKIKDCKISKTKNVISLKPITVKPTPKHNEDINKNINKQVDKEIKFYDNMILLHQKQIETYKQLINKLMCQYETSSKESSESKTKSKSSESD